MKASHCIWCLCTPMLEQDSSKYRIACPKCDCYHTWWCQSESDAYDAWNRMQGRTLSLWKGLRPDRYVAIPDLDKELMEQ